MSLIVLAYSGGLDTSVSIAWLKASYGYDVAAVNIDVGPGEASPTLVDKALAIGALHAEIVDAKSEFAEHYLLPALQANALYQGVYPLATALARPLIVSHLVTVARRLGAIGVAHGCTGKGNDQVRFDLALAGLAPDLKIVAPVREWAWSRDQEIAFAEGHGIPVPATKESPFSVDENLWGRSVEGGILEDPWQQPPEACYARTVSPLQAPEAPEYVTVGFEAGVPVSFNGEPLALVPLIEKAAACAGRHGVGRIDLIEDRVVGIKSREVYEAPAAALLIAAHTAAEQMTLPRDLLRHKAALEKSFAELTYDGLWFSPQREAISAFIASTQKAVTAEIRLCLYKGSVHVVGRSSAKSLYRHELATYGSGDAFDAKAAVGFIELFGLPLRSYTTAQQQEADPVVFAAATTHATIDA